MNWVYTLCIVCLVFTVFKAWVLGSACLYDWFAEKHEEMNHVTIKNIKEIKLPKLDLKKLGLDKLKHKLPKLDLKKLDLDKFRHNRVQMDSSASVTATNVETDNI